MKKAVLLMVLIILVAIGIAGSSKLIRNSCMGKQANILVRPVPVAQAEALKPSIRRSFPGAVKAAKEVDLSFSVSGLLCELFAEKGKKIKKGDILAILDKRDFEHALASAKANYVKTKLTLARIKHLRDKNISSQAEYEKAQADFDTATAKMNLKQKALDDTVLFAPFDSVIADRHVENFEHVNARNPIVSLYDMSKIEVVIQVSESLIRDNSPDCWQNIKVHFDSKNSISFSATVKEYQATPDSMTGTYDVTLLIKPSLPDHIKLLPGMTATVNFTTGLKTKNKVSVPVDAVFNDSDGNTYVWVINPQGGLPDKRKIVIGIRYNDKLEVISGLKSDEYVAVAGINKIRTDQSVRPQKTGKDGLEG